MVTENLTKLLKKIKTGPDGKYISHVPDNFFTKKKIENFLLARKEEEEKKLVLQSKPYKIIIEPTNSCNLGCPLCPTGINAKTREKGLLKLDEFKKLIDQVKETAIEIYLQNWGEATLVKNLPEMINYASSNGIWVYLSTNFSINYKNNLIERIVKSGLGVLHIDLDGVTQEVYEKYRIKGNLKTVIDNLKYAIKYKKENKLEFPSIKTEMIVLSSNEHQIQDFIDLSKSLGVDEYELHNPQVNPSSKESLNWLPKENKKYIYKTYRGTKKIEPCHWPWSGIVLNWDGGISACCIVDDPKSDFGDFKKSSLETIWNNDSYISARAEFGDQSKIKKQTICNICKNDTHNPLLKRNGTSFSILK